MTRIRIPLSVDAQLRIPIGPMQVPVRTCIALGLAVLPACIAFEVAGSIAMRLGTVVAIFGIAVMVASPMREGIWVGTIFALRRCARWLPTETADGAAVRPKTPHRKGWHRFIPRPSLPLRLRALGESPHPVEIGEGMFELSAGGCRGVVVLQGPPTATDSTIYARWCENVVRWLRQLDVPTQIVAAIGHVNAAEAEAAFDSGCTFQPADGPLVREERAFAGDMASRSVAFTHYVILAPHLASRDGVPRWVGPPRSTTRIEAEHVLAAAVSSGRSAGGSPP